MDGEELSDKLAGVVKKLDRCIRFMMKLVDELDELSSKASEPGEKL